MDNPYWHDDYKPHLVDRDEIRRLCFEIFSIVRASTTQQGSGIILDEGEEREEFTILEQLFFRMAEAELSRHLLRLALLIRTFDDAMARSDDATAYELHCKKIEEETEFGTVYKGREDITKRIRECCNKIIHAEDVRPVYETEDDRDDPNATWGMTCTLELEGVVRDKPWQIAIYLPTYLEGVLELIGFGDSAPSPR